MKQLFMKWRGTELNMLTPVDPEITIKSFKPDNLEDLVHALTNFNDGQPMTKEEVGEVILNAYGVRFDGIFLAYYNQEAVGTTTGRFNENKKLGTIHMVGALKKMSGKKLGKALCEKAMLYLIENGCTEINLTTDDFRLPAIKTYLSLGFKPILWDDDMYERWSKVIASLGIDCVDAYASERSQKADVKIDALQDAERRE